MLRLLMVLFLVAGCTTVADIRQMPADRMMESPKNPQEIAQCALYRAPAEAVSKAAHYHFTLSENPQGTYHLLAELPSQPAGEIDFLPKPGGGTLIQMRARWNFWGREALWACIQNCAQNSAGK